MKKSTLILLSIICININAFSQMKNDLGLLLLYTPCKLSLTINDAHNKSYSCQYFDGSIINSYRVSIKEHTHILSNMSYSSKQAYINKAYQEFNDYALNSAINGKTFNINGTKFIQYDEYVSMEDLTLLSRSVYFMYKSHMVAIIFLSSKESFDDRFKYFFNQLELK